MDPRRLLLPLGALASLALVLTLVLGPGRGLVEGDARAQEAPAAVGTGTDDTAPRALLATWDERRARAWAAGDSAALRALYVPGSRTGRADVALMGAYADRGLTVTGMQTQVLSLEVLHHDPDRLELVVTDRLVGGTAVGDGVRRQLPVDRPSVRRITMRKAHGEWLVAEVTDQDSPEASTSTTSSSSKS